MVNRKNLRKKAQAAVRFRLYFNGIIPRCHWCDEQIVWIASVARHRRIKQTRYHLTYRTPKGAVIKRAIATVDHVKPLGEGGSNHIDNTVPACARCNFERNELTMKAKAAERRQLDSGA